MWAHSGPNGNASGTYWGWDWVRVKFRTRVCGVCSWITKYQPNLWISSGLMFAWVLMGDFLRNFSSADSLVNPGSFLLHWSLFNSCMMDGMKSRRAIIINDSPVRTSAPARRVYCSIPIHIWPKRLSYWRGSRQRANRPYQLRKKWPEKIQVDTSLFLNWILYRFNDIWTMKRVLDANELLFSIRITLVGQLMLI